MKICIVSDSHDKCEHLETAVREAKATGAEAVFHCGDVVNPETLKVIVPFGLPIHVIHGNNSGDLSVMAKIASDHTGLVHYYGHDASFELAGKRIFLVHFPEYADGMSNTGDWDLVCCGHSHKAGVNTVANKAGSITHLVNPGSVGGIMAPATWILGDLDTMRFTIHEITDAIGQQRETA